MDWEFWKQKLSSRKLWGMLAGTLTTILATFGVCDNVIAQVTAIVGGLGVIAVYILAEAKVDAKRKDGGDDV